MGPDRANVVRHKSYQTLRQQFSQKNGAPFLLPVKSVHEFLATSSLRSRKKRCYSTGVTEINRLRTTWTVASGRARWRFDSILLQQAPTPKNTTSRPSAVPSAVRVHHICSCQCSLRSPIKNHTRRRGKQNISSRVRGAFYCASSTLLQRAQLPASRERTRCGPRKTKRQLFSA